MMQKKRFTLDVNAPVILGMAFLSLVALMADQMAGVDMVRLFGAYRTHASDAMQYPRLFTHVLIHAGLSHYTNNFMMILAIGPMIEEKYGSLRLFVMIVITAFITGLINVLLFSGTAVVGASGVLFMMILLASFTNMRQRKLPLTVLLVAFLYIGNEIIAGLFTVSNISRLSHILGGVCGACFGILLNTKGFAKTKN